MQQYNDSLSFCFTHRLMTCSTFIREASSCSILEQIQRPMARHCAENQKPFSIRPKWDTTIKPLQSRLIEPCRRGGRKNVRVKVCGKQEENKILQKYMMKAHCNSQTLRQHVQGLHRSAPGTCFLWIPMCSFYGIRDCAYEDAGSVSSPGLFHYVCLFCLIPMCFFLFYFIITQKSAF